MKTPFIGTHQSVRWRTLDEARYPPQNFALCNGLGKSSLDSLSIEPGSHSEYFSDVRHRTWNHQVYPEIGESLLRKWQELSHNNIDCNDVGLVREIATDD